ELAELAEAEDAGVELLPMRDAAVVDVVGQVVDRVEAGARRVAFGAVLVDEVDVIDVQVLAVAVDEVDQRMADAADGRDVELHYSRANVDRLRAALDRERVSLGRVAHPEPHSASRGAMFGGEIGGRAPRLVIGNEVDAALAPELHGLASVTCDPGKSHALECGLQDAFFRRTEFQEFEAIEAERIVKEIRHGFQCNRLPMEGQGSSSRRACG